MAELPTLGKHCRVPSCKQLDFLPFECDGCQRIFCSNHRMKESHECTEEHIQKPSVEFKGPKGFTCFLEGCSNRELTPLPCEHCHNSFCLRHRHQQDHFCVMLKEDTAQGAQTKISKTAEHVNKIIASKPVKEKKFKGGKSAKTAAKLAVMKMKMHAVGDRGTPEEEKVYLQVIMPLCSQQKPKPMFFSKTWSVGRIIDCIANIAGLKNENNLHDKQKLRLFVSGDGSLLPTDRSLDSFVTEEYLFSGSSVILEYVDSNCVQLEDLSKYSQEKT